MKNRFLLILFILLFNMVSCSSAIQEENKTIIDNTTMEPVITTTDNIITTYDPILNEPSQDIIVSRMRTERNSVETDNTIYYYDYLYQDPDSPYGVWISGISSSSSEVTFYHIFDNHPKIKKVYLKTIELPNIKILNVSEGIEEVYFENDHSDLSMLEILNISASCHTLSSNDLSTSGAFHLELSNLKEIHVVEGNAHYWDIEGVLFTNHSFIHDATQASICDYQLVCVPQNYQNETGILKIPENTTYIRTAAIYQSKNLDTIIIPDTVISIAPQGITASPNHPLTVICSPGSVAAQYVEQFGEMYHLILQFTE